MRKTKESKEILLSLLIFVDILIEKRPSASQMDSPFEEYPKNVNVFLLKPTVVFQN